MAATNDPAATAVPEPAAQAPPAQQRQLAHLDTALLVLVLVLAFFLGSFAAANSDLLMHLALANPFAGEASRWPHHAWLPSLLVGLVYEPFSQSAEVGGAVAVVLKALVVVGIAAVLLQMRRRDQSLLLPIAGTALAVLVMSPRLLLQPFVLSLLLLAATLWVLLRSGRGKPRLLWALPALFALWVNLDAWFVLGPLTVALFLFGEWLQGFLGIPAPADGPVNPERKPAPPPAPAAPAPAVKSTAVAARGRRAAPPPAQKPARVPVAVPPTSGRRKLANAERLKQLGLALLAGIAACLVNPWLFRAWTLPDELAYLVVATVDALPPAMTAAGQTLYRAHQGDPSFHALLSPLSTDYWKRPSVGLNVAGLAYFVLLLGGAASFYLATIRARTDNAPRPGVSLPQFVLFVFFAILSLVSLSFIPLFAVVAAPIAVLNLQDFVRRRWPAPAAPSQRDQNVAFAWRGGALVVGLLLVVCAWPGWLHAHPDDPRLSHRVRWQVQEDPGVTEAAHTIDFVRENTRLMKRGFAYDPEGASAFVWAARHGSGDIPLVCDTRYGLYADKAEAYGKVRRALRECAEAMLNQQDRDAQLKLGKAVRTASDFLNQQGFDFLVVTGCNTNPQHQQVAHALLNLPLMFTLLYSDGRTAVYGWRGADSGNPDIFEPVRLDLWRLAPSPGKPTNVPRFTLDTTRVPPVPTGPQSGWSQFFRGPPPVSPATAAAANYQMLFQVERNLQPSRLFITWFAGLGGAPVAALDLAKGGPEYKDEKDRAQRKQLLVTQDLGPAGAAVLSVRSARQAVLDSPYDVASYWQLFQSTQLQKAGEDHWAKTSGADSVRGQFRQVVLLTALNHAATVQPFNAEIHRTLYILYAQMPYNDLAFDHLTKFRQTLDESRLPKDQVDAVDAEIKQWTDRLKSLREQLRNNTAPQMDAVEKFELALFGTVSKPGERPGTREGVQPLGLAKQALQYLLEAKAERLSQEQQQKLEFWRVYLLLFTGRAKEAQERLKAASRDKQTPGQYDQLQAMAAAALGDYAAADKHLAEAVQQLNVPPKEKERLDQLHRHLLSDPMALVGELAASAGPGPGWPAARLGASLQAQKTTGSQLVELGSPALYAAQLHLMRGLLALEAGDLESAGKHFEAVEKTAPRGLRFPDRAIALRCLELMK
jgi:hypothetical protein